MSKRRRISDAESSSSPGAPNQAQRSGDQGSSVELVAAARASNAEISHSLAVPVNFRAGFPKLLFEELQSENSEIVYRATEELAAKVKSCALQEFKEFCALGGQATLIVVMRRWAPHAGIQTQGSRCIATMLFVCPDSLFYGVEASLHLTGWMELSVEAMLRFPADQELQCCAIGSLGNLYSKSYRSATDPKQRALVRFVNELNGITLVTTAMRRFPTGEGVQEEGCWLLARLCALGFGQIPAMRDLALSVVSTALQNFSHNPGLAASARSFLGIVS